MRIITVLFAALLSAAAQGGTWGTGKWGTMVWGATPQGNAGSPTVLGVDEGANELVFSLSYDSSSEDITGFRVVCTNIDDSSDVQFSDGVDVQPSGGVIRSDLTVIWYKPVLCSFREH